MNQSNDGFGFFKEALASIYLINERKSILFYQKN